MGCGCGEKEGNPSFLSWGSQGRVDSLGFSDVRPLRPRCPESLPPPWLLGAKEGLAIGSDLLPQAPSVITQPSSHHSKNTASALSRAPSCGPQISGQVFTFGCPLLTPCCALGIPTESWTGSCPQVYAPLTCRAAPSTMYSPRSGAHRDTVLVKPRLRALVFSLSSAQFPFLLTVLGVEIV